MQQEQNLKLPTLSVEQAAIMRDLAMKACLNAKSWEKDDLAALLTYSNALLSDLRYKRDNP